MSDPTTTLLVARGVSRSFGTVQALVDFDFDVDSGEVVALVGDNGAAITGARPAEAVAA